MQLVEIEKADLSAEQRMRIESSVMGNDASQALLVFDFSLIQSLPDETRLFFDSLTDRLKTMGSPKEYVIMGSSEVLRSFENSDTAKRARSMILVKESPVGKSQYVFKSEADRLNMTMQTSVVEAVQELCRVDCICEEVRPDMQMHCEYQYLAKLELHLENQYTVLFSMSKQDLLAFVSIMMQEEWTEIDEILLDWPAEIANHAANFLKILWGEDLNKRVQVKIPARISTEEGDSIRQTQKCLQSFIVSNEKFELLAEVYLRPHLNS